MYTPLSSVSVVPAPPSTVIRAQNIARVACAAAAVLGLAVTRAAGVALPPVQTAGIALSTYVAVILGVDFVSGRAERAGAAPFIILALADVAIIHVLVGEFALPAQYVAALFLSLLALQLAHGALVATPAVVVIAATVLGSVALTTNAVERGATTWTSSVVWLLPLYLGVAVGDVVMHARFNRRLTTIVNLFANAERGDFDREYDARGDRATDSLALIGRAYNKLRAELASMVLTDPLTGCLNRRGFDREFGRGVARAARDGSEVALLAVDIDRFKEINDSYGHLAGDTVLRELADLLVTTARAGDVVGRVGGDELLVLLPGADIEDAGVVAERVSQAVREHHFITTRGRERVTVSVGIAAEQVHDPWIGHALRARADEALYVAKRLGRDRVTLWAPGIRSQATPPHASLAVDSSALHNGQGAMRRLERAD